MEGQNLVWQGSSEIYHCQNWKSDATFDYCWRVKSSFQLVLKESTPPCNSLFGSWLKLRCCSLVWPISLWTKTSLSPLGRDQSSFRLPAQLPISFGKNRFKPPNIWDQLFLTTVSGTTRYKERLTWSVFEDDSFEPRLYAEMAQLLV